jgi:uncharacterized membrane protein YqiK
MIVLGIIIGILLCIFVIVVQIWLDSRQIGVKRLETIIKQQIRPTAQILKPRSQKELDINKIISENDRKGVDTRLEDLNK